MKADDKKSFIEYRIQQESDHFSGIDNPRPIDSILTLELNITELCNRTCVFCPRHDPKVYQNRNLHMSLETAEIIAKKLGEEDYRGKISFTGFSENYLNKNFFDIVKIFRNYLSDNVLECNTNGDFVTEENTKLIFNNGLTLLYINLYDGIEQIEKFDKLFSNANISVDKFKYRAHYSQKDYGLKINNRGGAITWLGFDESDIESLKGTPCYYPFYKMFVDYDGSALFCCNDWGKEIILGNLVEQNLFDVWFSDKMYEIRKKLSVGGRNFSPCKSCSVNGQLFGKKSFDLINEYYENSNNK